MSGHDVGDVCRQIAAERADRLVSGRAPATCGADPLGLIARLDAYAEALRDLSGGVADEVKEEPPR